MTLAEKFNEKLRDAANSGNPEQFKGVLDKAEKDPAIVESLAHNNMLFLMFRDGSVHTTNSAGHGDLFGGTMNSYTALKIISENLPRAKGGH